MYLHTKNQHRLIYLLFLKTSLWKDQSELWVLKSCKIKDLLFSIKWNWSWTSSHAFKLTFLSLNYFFDLFFWSIFSRIRTKCKEIRSMSLYSTRIRENTDQKNSEYGHFSRTDKQKDMLKLTLQVLYFLAVVKLICVCVPFFVCTRYFRTEFKEQIYTDNDISWLSDENSRYLPGESFLYVQKC